MKREGASSGVPLPQGHTRGCSLSLAGLRDATLGLQDAMVHGCFLRARPLDRQMLVGSRSSTHINPGCRFGSVPPLLSLWHATRLVDPFFHCLECTEPVRRPERMSPSHDAWHAGGTSRNNTCSRAASLRTVGFSGLVRPNGRTPLHICRAACTGLDDECQFSRASPSSRCVAGGRIEATTASRSSGGLD